MPWTRLDPVAIVDHLHFDRDPAAPGAEALAAQALAHLRAELLNGHLIAVQDHLGRTFIGTEVEAAEHMMEHAEA